MYFESLFSSEWTAPTTMAISHVLMVYNKRFVMNGKHKELN